MISLAILWHQHQPYYPDDVSGHNPMPWVRLHGVKDYYGMALHLLEVPEMRCTINLVPSLLEQLRQYTDEGRGDRFLDASRAPADGLAEADAVFLLDHFFMANPQTMVLPHPRYAELYHRRGLGKDAAREALCRFSDRDLRDLQVWFNLAWVHPLAFEHYESLRALRNKGRQFSEADKHALLETHLDILRQVVPLHRRLAESGQVELTTTPYYHPILPLLLDKKLAREAMPDAKLPQFTGGYPVDAAWHVRAALDAHERVFGNRPAGMWPAEGSVCQPMIPLLARHGVRWIATDEEVLGASTQGFVGRDARGHVRNPDALYRPYLVREGGDELAIVFRDHALSDAIGFRYQHAEPHAAAENFLGCLAGIDASVGSGESALVSVILDGENCWEHYPDGGVGFLRTLYHRCASSPHVRPVTVGEHLRRHPPCDALPRLFAGSWISHNFAIWVGHEEDNTAWDALHRTRERLAQVQADLDRGASGVSRGALDAAWREMHIAEGSDWFWWFGDDHSSAQDALFDHLFRKHLQNVYVLLGETPPAELARPISRSGRQVHHVPPRSLLDVKIDGRANFFEWAGAGHYACHNERGAMAMAMKRPMRELHFGFDLRRLLLRVDFDRRADEALAQYNLLRIGFIDPAGCELRVDEPGRPGQKARLFRDGEEVAAAGVEAGVGKIAELAVPFDSLGVPVGRPVQFFVELLWGGQGGGQGDDRAPTQGALSLERPSADFERIMWDV